MLPQTNQLTIIDLFNVDDDEFFFSDLGPILMAIEITCLKTTYEQIFIGTLIDLIKYLPNLRSLWIASLAMLHPRCLSVDEVRTLRLISNENKIIRMILQHVDDLAQVQFLLDLCPRAEYLEIDCTNGVISEEFIRFILMKNIKSIPNLSVLCLNILPTTKDPIDKLKRMINFEQLHSNYSIKRIDNKVYFQIY